MKKRLLFLALLSIMSLSMATAQDYCLRYDGVNSRVKYTNDATLDGLNGATDYTIEAWFYPTDTDIHNRVILKRWRQFAITLYQNNNKRIYFTQYTNNGQTRVYVNSLNNVINLNQWNHVAVINNSTDDTLKIYVNGVDVTADSSGTATTQTALPLDAAPGADANFYVAYGGVGTVFTGYVDKVRVKKSAEDIANLNTSDPLSMPYTVDSDTVLFMNFNEGNGTVTINNVNDVPAELQCRGGCAEIPVWFTTEASMAGVNSLNQIDFSIYPNPVTQNMIMIQPTDNQVINQIDIMDITGKLVRSKIYKEKQNNLRISTTGLTPGAYLVKLTTNKGVGVQKLIVK